MMKGYIYIFRRVNDNSICYVGKHNGSDINYLTSSTILRKKLLKNGIVWFDSYYKREIIHENIKTLQRLNSLEIEYIEKYKTYKGKNVRGYNISKGGDGGDMFTNNPNKEEVREKYSKAAEKRHKKGISKTLGDILKSNPQFEQKRKQKLTEMWMDPERRKITIDKINKNRVVNPNLSTILKNTFNDPKHRIKRSNQQNKRVEDTSYREKQGIIWIYIYSINFKLIKKCRSKKDALEFLKIYRNKLLQFLDRNILFNNEYYLTSNEIK